MFPCQALALKVECHPHTFPQSEPANPGGNPGLSDPEPEPSATMLLLLKKKKKHVRQRKALAEEIE